MILGGQPVVVSSRSNGAWITRVRCLGLILGLVLLPVQVIYGTAIQTSGITVTHAVQLDPSANEDMVFLAGLMERGGGGGHPALAVYWVRDDSFWFPTWQLMLSGAVDLLPDQLAKGQVAGQEAVVLARTTAPQKHTYQTTLSYSASLGALAVKVYDLTEDQLVYADGFSVGSYGGQLDPVSGTGLDDYVPVATTWQVGIVRANGSFFVKDSYEPSDPVVIRLHSPSAVLGEYRIYSVRGEFETLIASLTPAAREHHFSLDLSQLPLGASTLRLDYVDGGEILFSETHPLHIGRLVIDVAPLQPAREVGMVRTELDIKSVEPYAEEIQIDVHADLFELVWDDESKAFQEIPYGTVRAAERMPVDLSRAIARLPLEIPMPDRAANWKVVLSVEILSGVAVQLSGNERLFSSHLPAQVTEGDPYTIVVFPDTQNMTQSYPLIYTRMTDWISAHASEYNIAAALHVGDITNNNTAQEWLNAHNSMSLLHGVVPYALTLGNHDMIPSGWGELTQRGKSLIDDFFSVDEARRYSNLMGTMVPDRLANHYHVFSIGKDDYLVISLEFGPPDEAIEWANEVARRYPDHRMILLTHSYSDPIGSLSRNPLAHPLAENPETTVNTAFELWSQLVSINANSFMTVSGHLHSDPVVPYRVATGRDGHFVYELLFNWQQEPNGGNGWLGLITFHPNNTMEVSVYSPYLGEYARQRSRTGFVSRVTFDLQTGGVQHMLY